MKRCPKTVTGKHHWKANHFGYGNNYMICEFCDIIDDRIKLVWDAEKNKFVFDDRPQKKGKKK